MRGIFTKRQGECEQRRQLSRKIPTAPWKTPSTYKYRFSWNSFTDVKVGQARVSLESAGACLNSCVIPWTLGSRENSAIVYSAYLRGLGLTLHIGKWFIRTRY